MSSSWQAEYQKLGGYIKAHPEIEIEPNRMYIPKEARGEFNELFEAVLEAFVDDTYPELPQEVTTLSNSYKNVENELLESLGLAGISMLAVTQNFLTDPKQSLIKVLYDDLFGLLQNKINSEFFTVSASHALDHNMDLYYTWGYEMWLTLEILKMLEPERVYRMVFGTGIDNHLEEIDTVPIGRERVYPLSGLPDFVIYSGLINRYVAFKSELKQNITNYYGRVIDPREFKAPSDSPTAFGSRILVLHFTDKSVDISLVDNETREVASPRAVIEYFNGSAADEENFTDAITKRKELLRPETGIYLLTDSLPVKLPSLPDGMNLIEVGFDEFKLLPVVRSFAQN